MQALLTRAMLSRQSKSGHHRQLKRLISTNHNTNNSTRNQRRHYFHHTPGDPIFTMLTPRLTLLRVVMPAGTAAVGYVAYKVDEGRRWFDDKLTTVSDMFTGVFPLRQRERHNTDITDGDNNDAVLASDNTNAHTHTNDAHSHINNHKNTAPSNNGEFSGFIKKMIEIEEMLRRGDIEGQGDGLSLPKIVVVGSQSAGKTSVLESIVGHSFLPKGANMVTRRPLLLTLVNDQNCTNDYAVFPTAQGAIRIDDFDRVAERVKEMNMAVPDEEWVSEVPVELHIHSRHLPDLTLIDLPGYIAIHNRRQPALLRQRIVELCDRFLGEPNIILAVSAADVDLANSEALQAARRHDPLGGRTIGVITKLDLVSPEHGSAILENDDYPLGLGYVGVICAGNSDQSTSMSYFEHHKEQFKTTNCGVDTLKLKLVSALQASLKACTKTLLSRVNDELADIRYELKTRYDDKCVSAEGYLTEVVGRVREVVERLSSGFTRATVRAILGRNLFDRHVVDLILDHLDDDDDNTSGTINRQDLHHMTSQLTRAGWGRRCANSVASDLLADIKAAIIDSGPLAHHPAAASALMQAMETTCRQRVAACAEQIENALKPFKQPDSLEFTVSEWKEAKRQLLSVLEADRRRTMEESRVIAGTIGGMDRLRRVMERLARQEHCSVVDSDAAHQVMALYKRERLLQRAMSRIRSPCCTIQSSSVPSLFFNFFTSSSSTHDNNHNHKHSVMTRDPVQLSCPQVYLFMVSRAIQQQAALYAQDELAPDQRLRLPDLLLERHRHDPVAFLQENEAVFRHVELLRRADVLGRVRERLMGV